MAQTIGEAIWEEGRLKGLSEGQFEASRELLRALLSDRFGAVPEAVLQHIAVATDVNRLRTAALQVSRITRPEDLQL